MSRFRTGLTDREQQRGLRSSIDRLCCIFSVAAASLGGPSRCLECEFPGTCQLRAAASVLRMTSAVAAWAWSCWAVIWCVPHRVSSLHPLRVKLCPVEKSTIPFAGFDPAVRQCLPAGLRRTR